MTSTLDRRLAVLEATAAHVSVKPSLLIAYGDDPALEWARQYRTPYPGADGVTLIILRGVKPERRHDD